MVTCVPVCVCVCVCIKDFKSRLRRNLHTNYQCKAFGLMGVERHVYMGVCVSVCVYMCMCVYMHVRICI